MNPRGREPQTQTVSFFHGRVRNFVQERLSASGRKLGGGGLGWVRTGEIRISGIALRGSDGDSFEVIGQDSQAVQVLASSWPLRRDRPRP